MTDFPTFFAKSHTYQEAWDEITEKLKSVPAGETVLVVDADGLVFRTASASDTRSILVNKKGFTKFKQYNTRTEFKEYCKEKGFEYADFEIQDQRDAEDVSFCLGTLKRTIKNLKEKFNTEHLIFFIGGVGNFRLTLPLPVQYKSNRIGMSKPTHLQACREYLLKWYDTYMIDGCESDDLVVGVTQYITHQTDKKCVAWNIDKDFTQSLLPVSYYHPVDGVVYDIEGGLGELHEHGKGVKGSGLKWLIGQLLLGDKIDSYCPKQFFRKRYGERAFYKDFKDLTTEKEVLERWVEVWRKLVGETITFTDYTGVIRNHSWLSLAELYFLCCYMRTSPIDDMTFKKLLNQYGVTYD